MKLLIALSFFLSQGFGTGHPSVAPESSCKTLVDQPCTGCTDGTRNIICRAGSDYKSCTGPSWVSCTGTGNQCRQYGAGVACTTGSGQ